MPHVNPATQGYMSFDLVVVAVRDAAQYSISNVV